jgi:hypothetical protein
MVRPVESIRKDLNALEGATATLADEFSQIYATYLTVLGHALRRQVIMATYHLCTQVYPEAFLALPVSDRTRLQQGIQDLGHKAQSWLQQLMEPAQTSADPEPLGPKDLNSSNLNRLEAALAALTHAEESAVAESSDPPNADSLTSGPPDISGPLNIETVSPDASPNLGLGVSDEVEPEGSEPEGPELDEPEEPEPADEAALALDPQKLVQSVIMAAISSEVQEAFSDRPFTGDDLTPTLVAKHHLILEQMIRDVLQRVSRKANQLLRKAKVTPDLPEAVVEAASDADVAMPKGRSVPNVLNVLVAMASDMAAEFDGDDDPDNDINQAIDQAIDDDDDEALEGTMTHLAAVQLRLSDLEFGDVQTALWRSKLRTAVGRLRKLGKQYQRAERELAIAQAEQAWRAVWYDDSSR